MQTTIIGDKDNGIICTYEVSPSREFLGFHSIVISIFGVEQPLENADRLLLQQLEAKCMEKYFQNLKFKSIENDFKERLGETVICDNEVTYDRLLWEFAKKTEADENMDDLNA